MVQLPSTCSSVSVASVESSSAVKPAFPKKADRAIVKHPACAAAISSSGFVPIPFSNRVENEYWVLLRTPLCVDTVPCPFFRSPCQTADAVRFIGLMGNVDSLYHSRNVYNEKSIKENTSGEDKNLTQRRKEKTTNRNSRKKAQKIER